MKTKNLSLQFLFAFFFIFSVGNLNAQCPPFNAPAPCHPAVNPPPTPPNENQSPNEDKETSPNNSSIPTKHIPLCFECGPGNPPGGYYGGGDDGEGLPECIFDEIENTGNDIQIIKHLGLVAKAMVWDSDCPAFSLIISGYPLEAAFVVELNANIHGTIHDPDIVISQQNVGTDEIGILIVFEYINSQGKRLIAYEQWNYNYRNRYIEMVYSNPSLNPDNINIISDLNEISTNPNIDANNANQVAITFEMGEEIYSYLDEISALTILNPSDKINISHCIGSGNMRTPDVSISDAYTYSSVVSYVFNHGNNLYVVQDEFASILPSSILCPPNSKIINISSNDINPRISSPAYFDIRHEYECAITAVDINYRTISVFHNYTGSFAQILLNYDPNSQQLLQHCNNTMPSISYTGAPRYAGCASGDCGHYVAVAWTYDDCMSPPFLSGTKDVVSVTLSLPYNARKPNLSDFFMLVNQNLVGEQYASSVAGEGHTNHAGDYGEAFYSMASSGPDKMIYKISNSTMQPWLRKKLIEQKDQKSSATTIFPNPSNGKINIDLTDIDYDGSVEVSVFSMDGRKIFEEGFPSKSVVKEIDLSRFESGIYFMNIKAGNYITYEQVTISK